MEGDGNSVSFPSSLLGISLAFSSFSKNGANPSVGTVRDGHTYHRMDCPAQTLSSPSASAWAGEAEAGSPKEQSLSNRRDGYQLKTKFANRRSFRGPWAS